MNPQYIGEFMGTLVLVLIGNGVVANVVLKKTLGSNSGWAVIVSGYGLGVVMYETLLGFPPFDGADSYSISYKHVTEIAVAPDVVDSRIPQQMAAIVMRCLEKNPAHRFERGNDLADALINFLSTAAAHHEFRMARTARSIPTQAVAAG